MQKIGSVAQTARRLRKMSLLSSSSRGHRRRSPQVSSWASVRSVGIAGREKYFTFLLPSIIVPWRPIKLFLPAASLAFRSVLRRPVLPQNIPRQQHLLHCLWHQSRQHFPALGLDTFSHDSGSVPSGRSSLGRRLFTGPKISRQFVARKQERSSVDSVRAAAFLNDHSCTRAAERETGKD